MNGYVWQEVSYNFSDMMGSELLEVVSVSRSDD